MPVLRCEDPSFSSREKLSKRSSFFISAGLIVIFGGYDRRKKPDNHVYLVMIGTVPSLLDRMPKKFYFADF